MKATITSSSGKRHANAPEEINIETIEQLRDFILSVNHHVVVSIRERPILNKNGGVVDVEIVRDELDIEIYDEYRE